jgi:hypothetical protein
MLIHVTRLDCLISAGPMEYFSPQAWLFNSPLLPRLKRLFYFETVV